MSNAGQSRRLKDDELIHFADFASQDTCFLRPGSTDDVLFFKDTSDIESTLFSNPKSFTFHFEPSELEPPHPITQQFYVREMSPLQSISLRQPLEPVMSSGCSCKKSKCLKLYCECLLSGTSCNSFCKCSDCGNASKLSPDKESSKKRVSVRSTTKGNNVHCFCKKNRCSQRYCECLRRGRQCGSECECCECENGLRKKKK